MRRFATITQRTQPRKTKKTNNQYSPPPTPIKPKKTPMSNAKKPPNASPNHRSTNIPKKPSKKSSQRIDPPSTFPKPPLNSSQQTSQRTWTNIENNESPRRPSFQK